MASAGASGPSRAPAIRDRYDVLVVGGGPAGTTFAQLMARRGHDVLLVERARHPRFCVGESLLPATLRTWRELGLVERFEKAGFLRKYGAYFCFEDGRRPEYFHFADASRAVGEHAYEVPRAAFDQLLWEAALEAGVNGVDGTSVRDVIFDGSRATGAELRLPDGSDVRVGARLVADCSGRSTLLGRKLGTRERDPRLDKVALYCHYDDVIRSTGRDAGTIAIIATPFGWMWLIPFTGGAASVGALVDGPWFGERRKAGVRDEAIWGEILAGVPAVSRRLAGAVRTRPVEASADFQYRVRRLAGDGWVAIGDAGAFLDPVFSSGVHLAVTGARRAGRAAATALAGGRLPRARDFARYARRTRASLWVYSRFITSWYDPAFRQVFMRPPRGRAGVEWLKREVISVLAGAESPAWRALPPIEVLRLLARLRGAAGAAPGAGPAA
jgi:flavin-dependent dehydrogenase